MFLAIAIADWQLQCIDTDGVGFISNGMFARKFFNHSASLSGNFYQDDTICTIIYPYDIVAILFPSITRFTMYGGNSTYGVPNSQLKVNEWFFKMTFRIRLSVNRILNAFFKFYNLFLK